MELTPAQIVSTLSQIGRDLDAKAVEVENLDRLFVSAKAEYRVAFAEAFLTAEGSNEVRRMLAEVQTAELHFAMEAAEQVLRAAREGLRTLRDRLEIGRSLSAVMRLEYAGQS